MNYENLELPAYVSYKPSRQIKKEWLGKTRWLQLYEHYYWRIYSLFCSMFEWDNIPPTMDEAILEQDLIFNGCAVILKDDITGEMVNLRGTGYQLDIYGRPLEINAYGRNGSYRRFGLKNFEDCVLMYNNKFRTPLIDLVQIYASDLAECHHAMEINLKQQKTPITILGSKQQIETMRRIYEAYDSGYPVLIQDKDATQGIETKLLMTNVDFKGNDLEQLKRSIMAEVLTFAGVNNINFEKRERLTTTEGDANNDMIYIMRQYMLKSRQIGADQVNALYGSNIQPRFTAPDKINSEDLLDTVGGGEVDE